MEFRRVLFRSLDCPGQKAQRAFTITSGGALGSKVRMSAAALVPVKSTHDDIPTRALIPQRCVDRCLAVATSVDHTIDHFGDSFVDSGLYQTLPLPGVPGIEAVGVVEAVGSEVTGAGMDEGQRVRVRQ